MADYRSILIEPRDGKEGLKLLHRRQKQGWRITHTLQIPGHENNRPGYVLLMRRGFWAEVWFHLTGAEAKI